MFIHRIMSSSYHRPLLAGSLLLIAPTANAGVMHSGIVDIPIPNTFDGIYLDIDTGLTAGNAFNGWDINFMFNGAALYTNDTFLPVKASADWDDAVLNLGFGELVAPSSQFFSSGIGASETHLGSGASQFDFDQPGFIGFQFTPNGSESPNYGWMRVTLSDSQLSAQGIIHEWAWEDSGAALTVSSVPEPSSMILLSLGTAFGLSRRRRIRHS